MKRCPPIRRGFGGPASAAAGCRRRPDPGQSRGGRTAACHDTIRFHPVHGTNPARPPPTSQPAQPGRNRRGECRIPTRDGPPIEGESQARCKTLVTFVQLLLVSLSCHQPPPSSPAPMPFDAMPAAPNRIATLGAPARRGPRPAACPREPLVSSAPAPVVTAAPAPVAAAPAPASTAVPSGAPARHLPRPDGPSRSSAASVSRSTARLLARRTGRRRTSATTWRSIRTST